MNAYQQETADDAPYHATEPSHKISQKHLNHAAQSTKPERTMKTKDFTTTITVNQSPKEVFDAINNVRGWWSGEIEGRTDKLGAEFKYRYQDLHRSTQKIAEFVPGRKVVWQVVDSRINFVKDKTEWNGTEIVFEITKKANKTQLRFTHTGLVPGIECYGDCSGAWGFFIKDSLRSLITTGKGLPLQKE